MRQALAFSLTTVVEALRKAPRRITMVDPLLLRQARAFYRLGDDGQQL